MAVAGFNAGAEMSQLRTQQTLAMQATAPAAAAAPAAAPAAAAPADGSAATGPAGEAAVGAASVQPPPSTSKIVLQSVLKGAMTGMSVSLGFKQLSSIPFIGNMLGSLPKAAAGGTAAVAGKGLLGIIGKIPLLGTLATKAMPFLSKTGLAGFAMVALAGAAVGAIFGAIGGVKKAKAAQEEWAKQQAQTPPTPEPTPAPQPEPTPAPGPAPGKGKRAKSWIISRSGSTKKTGGSTGTYTTHKGDTLALLAKRFHTTVAEIRKLNPDLGTKVDPGTVVKLRRRVIPDAQAWTGS